MGLSGGSTSKSYSGSGQKWARGYAESATKDVMSTFNANQPGLGKLTDSVQSTVPRLGENFSGWQPTVGQSQSYYGDVLDGRFLDPSSNPGLQSVLDRNSRDVMGRVNSQFSLAGRYGSDAHVGAQTRELADSNGAILADAYNRERGYQDAAASAVNQGGASSLAQLLQAAGVGAELPYTGTSALSSNLSALFNGGTQTQKQSTGLAGVLGGLGSLASGVGALGGSGGAAALFSDRRLKSNIVKLGELDDGLGVYEYDIFGERQRGVMADEVEALRPWALGPTIEGFRTVDYQAL